MKKEEDINKILNLLDEELKACEDK